MKKIVIFCSFYVAYLSTLKVIEVVNNPIVITELVFTDKEKPFSEKALIDEIYKYNFKHPEIVLAQARLESGNFTSSIFLENNNLFGMKKAYSRPTTAVGEARGHAVYNSWQQSLADYALYSAAFLRYSSQEDVLAHLGRHYAEDPIYEDKVRRVIDDVYDNNIIPR